MMNRQWGNRIGALLFLFGLLLLSLGPLTSADTPNDPQPDPAPDAAATATSDAEAEGAKTLSVYYTCSNVGYIEPCG